MQTRKRPSDLVVDTFGSYRKAAKAIGDECGAGLHWTTVWGWANRSPQGNIPHEWHGVIIAAAKKQHGVKITYEDLAWWDESCKS